MTAQIVDANLLVALDALLAEHSVTRAAERLHTSPAAMSRTLGRLRRILGDPLLVRAGQAMVPTPRADAMRDEVAAVVRRCGALLGPGSDVDPGTLRRTFTLQAADVVAAGLAPGLLELAAAEAPGVSVRFLTEALEGGPALRDGRIDLEVGAIDHVDPETRTEELVRLRMVAGVRAGHPLTERRLTPARFAAAAHVVVSRRGRFSGPIDVALAELGLDRRVVAVLPSHLAAMTLAARTDLVCLAPTVGAEVGADVGADGRPVGGTDEGPTEGPDARSDPMTEPARALGLRLLEVPLSLPPVVIGMAWHPRHAADGGHGWLRSAVRRVLAAPAVSR